MAKLCLHAFLIQQNNVPVIAGWLTTLAVNMKHGAQRSCIRMSSFKRLGKGLRCVYTLLAFKGLPPELVFGEMYDALLQAGDAQISGVRLVREMTVGIHH